MVICKERGIYIWALCIVLMATIHSVGRTVATGADSDKASESSNSTLQNGRSEHRSTLAGANGSYIPENNTSNANGCKQIEALCPSSDRKRRFKQFVFVGLCLGVWSVVANSLPLAAIIRHERLHKPVYIVVANLASSDVLTGAAFVYASSSVLLSNTTDAGTVIVASRLRWTAIFLSGLSSAYSLLALTAERYWFIVHGMTYVNNVTNEKCKVVIVTVWVLSGLLAMLPNFGWHCRHSETSGDCLPTGGGLPDNYGILVLVFIFIPMAAIVYFNLGVFWCLWKHMNAIAAQEATVASQSSVNRKSAFTIVIITVVFLVGWLPISIRLATMTEDHLGLSEMLVFVIFNSAINPLIYGFRLREVRQGVARLFVKCCGNASVDVH
ncbi:G-protein coupled receptor 12-like [Branchiostoma floridae]|uniref:G-protein coupled receptor 12-like n=1 Tax=Branchiostoma floridae TaxID=7739 RepID=A0A9J7LR13_BRAFL|nr:G-protein coupled receptor 12-like [Branchiostoma floridae]